MSSVESRYLDGSYLRENPDWDRADATWKAAQVSGILKEKSAIGSICDVGCGAGEVLAALGNTFPRADLVGYDISPQLTPFWKRHPAIQFVCGDFHKINERVFDVLLMLDVFEHVRDPFTFLENSRRHARSFVFHIPLDLSALSVARGTSLMRQRRKVGHLHFYTKDLALETLQDCGYTIMDWRYTNAAATLLNHHTLLTRIASLPRKLMRSINADLSVRVLGGDTLIVLAR